MCSVEFKPDDYYVGRDKERFSDLVEVYNFLYGEDERLKLNHRILLTCVFSYFRDIKILKQFHGIKHADHHKQTAYTIKWISKLKPIQIVSEGITADNVYYANIRYALFAGLNFFPGGGGSISPNYLAHLARIVLHCGLRDMELFSSHMYLLEKASLKEELD